MSELTKLQKIADNQVRQKTKIEGNIEMLLEDLTDEGYNDVDVAAGEMILLGKKISRMRKALNNKTKKFMEKYKNELVDL